MNLDFLQKCAERQHKATVAIAQNLVGLPATLISTLPLIAKKGTVLYFLAPSTAETDMDFVNPYIMNGSFALELKMKYLHALETGKGMENGHRLKVIFDSLTTESRSKIKAEFRAIVQQSRLHRDIAKSFNETMKIQFRWDVEVLLEKANLAFERWRYVYEGEDTTWFAGYSEIIAAINVRIRELEKQTA